jgi:hypothetical protein
VTLRGRDDLDAVGKSDTGDDLRQLICSFESAPGFRGGAAARGMILLFIAFCR